jgi:hypothetical protein
MDSSALSTSYSASYTTDCDGQYGGVDYDCCCYDCGPPVWANPSSDNQVASGSLVVSLDLHWIPLNTDDIKIYWKKDTSVHPEEVITITNTTILGSGDYTIIPGTTLHTPLGGFEDGERYSFRLVPTCCGTTGTGSATLIIDALI